MATIIKPGTKLVCIKDAHFSRMAYFPSMSMFTLNAKRGDIVTLTKDLIDNLGQIITNKEYFLPVNGVNEIIVGAKRRCRYVTKDLSRFFTVGQEYTIAGFSDTKVQGAVYMDYGDRYLYALTKESYDLMFGLLGYIVDDPEFGVCVVPDHKVTQKGNPLFFEALFDPTITAKIKSYSDLISEEISRGSLKLKDAARSVGYYESEVKKNMDMISESFGKGWEIDEKLNKKPVSKYKVLVGESDGRIVSIKTPGGETLSRFDKNSVVFSKQSNRLVNGKTKMTLDIYIDDDDIEFV